MRGGCNDLADDAVAGQVAPTLKGLLHGLDPGYLLGRAFGAGIRV